MNQAQTQANLRALARRLVERWYHNPVLFAWEALGVRCWKRQAEMLMAVAQNRRVAVRSGHKTGKSTSTAILTLWWLATRKDARVILTSAGGRQVGQILWRELGKIAKRRATTPFLTELQIQGLGGRLLETPAGGLTLLDGRQAIGFSTDKAELMAGFSGANIFFLADEASGVDDSIYQAIEGNLAGGGHIAAFSNPTQTSGWFYDAFHDQSDLWHGIQISSEETPNASGEGDPIPGLATAQYIADKRKACGAKWAEHPEYQVRVQGNFPAQGAQVVCGLSLVTEAEKRWETTRPDGPLVVGVDPARSGEDQAAVAPRRGKFLYEIQEFHGLDGPDLADAVIEVIKPMILVPGETVQVNIDSIGVGASCYDALVQKSRQGGLGFRLKVVPVIASEKSDDETKYTNKRAQVAFGFTEWMAAGGAIPPNKKLRTELVAPKYKFDAQNRYLIESKENIKKRIKRSPDRADAASLSTYEARRIQSVEPPVQDDSPYRHAYSFDEEFDA